MVAPLYESEFYKMEVGSGEDYEGDHYLIINKGTGVTEVGTRLFPQGVAYCNQLSDSYAEALSPSDVKESPIASDGRVIPHDFKMKH